MYVWLIMKILDYQGFPVLTNKNELSNFDSSGQNIELAKLKEKLIFLDDSIVTVKENNIKMLISCWLLHTH